MVARTNRRTGGGRLGAVRTGVAARLMLLAAGAAAAGFTGGCAPKAPRADAPRPVRQVRTSQDTRGADTSARQRPASRADAATALPAEDACAARLHDLSGLLLLYFVTNKHLPERLEDLAP